MTRALRTTSSAVALALLAILASLFSTNFLKAENDPLAAQAMKLVGSPRAGAVVQSGPGISSSTLDILHEESAVTLEQGPMFSDGIAWFLVSGIRGGDGIGWVNGAALHPIEAAAPAEAHPPSPEPEPTPVPERTVTARGAESGGRSLVARVTAYALRGRTASGMYTQWGVVAVDPRVIPLGSRLMIDGFEEVFIAADTGSGVKGNWVDIWFPTYADAMRFGVQSRRVTVLEP
ncbi:MAG TPA: 3D domain-containing protein [Chloroflexota bacterium]|nr:3D domain-containing protein [Chloroflexota bacterium]